MRLAAYTQRDAGWRPPRHALAQCELRWERSRDSPRLRVSVSTSSRSQLAELRNMLSYSARASTASPIFSATAHVEVCGRDRSGGVGGGDGGGGSGGGGGGASDASGEGEEWNGARPLGEEARAAGQEWGSTGEDRLASRGAGVGSGTVALAYC